MQARLEHWLKLDQSRDEEERRMRILLYSIGTLMIFFILASWIVSLAVSYYMTAITLTIGLVISLGLMTLNWSGRLEWAKVLYPILMLAFVSIAIWNGDGLYDEVLLALTGLLAVAGLLMGRRGVVIFTSLSVLVIAVVGYGHLGRWVDKYAGVYEPIRVVILGLMVILSGLLVYLAIDNLAFGNHRLRQNEQILSIKNKELEDIRASLEDLVAERTRRAEAARMEAEQAHADLQLQMWQVAGQEQLSEILRGEQNLELLADSVLSFLCRYLETPLGALFSRSQTDFENGWRFTGGYACRPGSQTPDFFHLGEGLVGQAAVERRLLTLEAIPAEQIQISSGLGQVQPNHLLLLPLLQAREVVGVIELAGLAPFAPQQIQFLNRSAESIAITLQTIRTRERLQALLQETQQQTEELQAQEEELRQANEQLRAQAEFVSSLQERN